MEVTVRLGGFSAESSSSSGSKTRIYSLADVSYADSDSFSRKAVLADLAEANKELGTEVYATDFNDKDQTVSLVGTRADIVKVCLKGRIFFEVDEFTSGDFDDELQDYDQTKFAALRKAKA